MAEHDVANALKHKGAKTHTHSVHYERAHNGGFHAHVTKHHEDGSHSHDEHHVLMSPEDAKEHLEEHMGDQPAVGGSEGPEEAAEGEGAGAGPGPGAAMAGAGAGAPPPVQ